MAFVIKQAAPGTSNTDIYTVPASTEAVVSTIAIANTTTSAVTYRIFVRIAGAAAAQGTNSLVYDSTVSANNTSFLTIGLALAATDVITVRASTTNVVFTAFVNESGV
jgi:hypothetical protein